MARGPTSDNRYKPYWLMDDLASHSVEDRIAYIEKWAATEQGDPLDWYTKIEDPLRLVEDLDGDGVADQARVVASFGAPVEFVEQVKRESSKFVKTLGPKYNQFYWQRGYGMFSVSPTHLADAEKYVRNQEEHHRQKTFQEELREFLDRYGVEYDERYVWD